MNSPWFASSQHILQTINLGLVRHHQVIFRRSGQSACSSFLHLLRDRESSGGPRCSFLAPFLAPAFARTLLNRCRATNLRGHRGCVNALRWSPSGSSIISGSDDLMLLLWRWPGPRRPVGRVKTGHHANILSVQYLPFSGDTMVASGSMDGRVCVSDVVRERTTLTYVLGRQDELKRV